MSRLEVIALVNNRRAGDLSPQQVALIRAQLEQDPQLYNWLGGREKVEAYLAEAPTPADEKADVTETETEDQLPPVEGERVAKRGRQWVLPVAFLLVLAGGGLWLVRMTLVDVDDANEQAVSAEAPTRPPPSDEQGSDADAWRGWTISEPDGSPLQGAFPAGGSATQQTHWDLRDPSKPRPVKILVTGQPGIRLSSTHQIDDSNSWLSLWLARHDGGEAPGWIEVRADGEPITRFDVSRSAADESYHVPLQAYRGKRVRLDLIHIAEDPEQLAWHDVLLVDDSQVGATAGLVVPLLADERSETSDASDTQERRVEVRSPFVLFEDEGDFKAVGKGTHGSATLTSDDTFSGSAAARIATGSYRLTFAHKVAIREQPEPLQLRYLRFAIRKQGGGAVTIELAHRDREMRRFIYDAGKILKPHPATKHSWDNRLPDEWIVITRDLYQDFGPCEITGLELMSLGGTAALFDHIYLARDQKDFDQLETHIPPAEANRIATRVLYDGPINAATRSMVVLEVEGLHGTGVIVSEDGYILTTGDVAVRSGVPAEVTLPDGKTATAETLGINRSLNIALVKLDSAGPWPHLDWNKTRFTAHSARGIAVAFGDLTDTRQIGWVKVYRYGGGEKDMMITHRFHWPVRGAPLMGLDGRLVGIHTRLENWAKGSIVVGSGAILSEWDRLAGGEVWGNWPPGAGPILGVDVARKEERTFISKLFPNTPAEGADICVGDEFQNLDGQPVAGLPDLFQMLSQKHVGDEVTVQLLRDEETITKTIKLGRRG